MPKNLFESWIHSFGFRHFHAPEALSKAYSLCRLWCLCVYKNTSANACAPNNLLLQQPCTQEAKGRENALKHAQAADCKKVAKVDAGVAGRQLAAGPHCKARMLRGLRWLATLAMAMSTAGASSTSDFFSATAIRLFLEADTISLVTPRLGKGGERSPIEPE